MIQIVNYEKFFELQKKFKHVPFTQSKGWYYYKHENWDRIVFFIDNESDPKIALWGLEQKIPFSRKVILRIDGECYQSDLGETMFKSFYLEIINLKYDAIEINSNNLYNIEYEIGLRRAGFKKPIALFACPLTIEVNFNLEFRFNNNWKRNVKKAMKNNLLFKELNVFNKENTKVIVDMFSEMAELKGLRFRLEMESLHYLLSSPDVRTFIVYDIEEKPLAARIIHVNRSKANDIFSANTLEARKFGATYFMMEKIFLKLKGEGYSFFDLNRIPPSDHATDNIYLYKNASRGNKIQFNGEWVFYKNSLLEGLIYLYKKVILKKQRY